jgi:hypothetical protein
VPRFSDDQLDKLVSQPDKEASPLAQRVSQADRGVDQSVNTQDSLSRALVSLINPVVSR